MLEELNAGVTHPVEKVHIAMDMIQSFAHEYVYDNHRYIDYDVMKQTVENTLIGMFKE